MIRVDESHTIISIGEFAFSDCSSLKTITIPESVTDIGVCAFDGTPWLTEKSSERPDHLVIVNNILLEAHDRTRDNYIIPNGITTIVDEAFGWCLSLKSITIPESVTKIGRNILVQCTSLTDITILNKTVSLYGKGASPVFTIAGDNYCILGDDSESDRGYSPCNSKTITIHGYTGSTAEQFAKLLDERKAEAGLNTVTFVALDGTGDTPTTPTNPSNPTTPTNPQQPTNPTNPTNPNNPTTPTNPSNPTQPSNPTNPSNPTTPTNPTQPTTPTKPLTQEQKTYKLLQKVKATKSMTVRKARAKPSK